MRTLSDVELLEAWERGTAQTPTERALTLLRAACDESSPETLGHLSIGQRDARLLALRARTFGEQLTSVVNCPTCGVSLEWNVRAADLCAGSEAAPADSLSADVEGYEVSFRLPNSFDLAVVTANVAEEKEATADVGRLLLDRCMMKAVRNGEAVPTAELPAAVTDVIVERMAEADPQAEVRIALTCPECNGHWRALFDIESFFWAELRAWAQGLLSEVHVLASAYGWRECDILNMSGWRRQFYLGLING